MEQNRGQSLLPLWHSELKQKYERKGWRFLHSIRSSVFNFIFCYSFFDSILEDCLNMKSGQIQDGLILDSDLWWKWRNNSWIAWMVFRYRSNSTSNQEKSSLFEIRADRTNRQTIAIWEKTQFNRPCFRIWSLKAFAIDSVPIETLDELSFRALDST